MATTKSASDYIVDPNVDVKKDTATEVAVSVGSSAKNDIVAQGEDLAKNWSISGASNGSIKNVGTGSGNDTVEFKAATDININVGTGKDKVSLGGGTGTSVVGASISGADGDKTIIIDGTFDPSYVSLTGSGNDVISITGSAEDSSIVSGAGRDVITIATDVTGSVINAGADNDSIRIGKDVDTTSIDLGDGRDTLQVVGKVSDSTILGGEGFDSIELAKTGAGAVSNTTISLGAGKDSLNIAGEIVDTNISTGADADSVTITGAKYSQIDLGEGNDTVDLTNAIGDTTLKTGAGKDVISVGALFTGTVNVTDYSVLEDVIVSTTPVDYKANGDVVITAGNAVNVSKTGEYYAVQHKTAAGAAATYTAWGDEDGSWIDLTNFNKIVTARGDVNGDVSDTILGGKKDDVIRLSANDYGYGGAGADTLNIIGGAATQEFVGLADAAGKDTVNGFAVTKLDGAAVAASSDEADVLYAFGTNIANVKLETVAGAAATEVIAKVGTGSVQITSTSGITSDAELNIKDNSGRVYDVDFVVGTSNVTGSTDELADVYYAGSSVASLNFGTIDSDLVVDLGNRKMTVNGTELDNTDNAVYYGKFASVTGGADNTVLMGAADAKETLIAGTGDTTLWGGGSKSDYMQHTGTTNTATFFFTAGDGTDTVNSNNWASSDTSDVLWLGSTAIKSVKNNGTDTTVTLDDGSKVTLSGLSATDTAFKFTTDGVNTQQIKVGTSGSNTWTYDEGVTYYMGGKKNTLNVSDDANIWLDGSNGKAFQNVTTVNASSNSGTVILAGAGANETLIAGTGSSSLWGGAGASNDVLQGNATGDTTFYFGKGEGADVITASNSDDKVVLYNVALSDVASADVNKSGAMEIKLHDGSSLTVNSVATGASTFQLGDGSTWKYNSSEGWKQA